MWSSASLQLIELLCTFLFYHLLAEVIAHKLKLSNNNVRVRAGSVACFLCLVSLFLVSCLVLMQQHQYPYFHCILCSRSSYTQSDWSALPARTLHGLVGNLDRQSHWSSSPVIIECRRWQECGNSPTLPVSSCWPWGELTQPLTLHHMVTISNTSKWTYWQKYFNANLPSSSTLNLPY